MLSSELGDNYKFFIAFTEQLAAQNISYEWRYYKDGGWLAKGVFKKTTVFWGGIKDGVFGIAIHFSEKSHIRETILSLDISEAIKNSVRETAVDSRMFSVGFSISDESQLEDISKLMEYKKRAK